MKFLEMVEALQQEEKNKNKIIVLLILAGVSISMLTGQNGILNRVAEAKEKTGIAQSEEKVKLAAMEL